MKERMDAYFDPIVPSEALVQKTLGKIKRQRRSKIIYLWQCAASVAACAALFFLTGALGVQGTQGDGATASVFATGTPRLLPVLLLVVLLSLFTALYVKQKKEIGKVREP